MVIYFKISTYKFWEKKNNSFIFKAVVNIAAAAFAIVRLKGLKLLKFWKDYFCLLRVEVLA